MSRRPRLPRALTRALAPASGLMVALVLTATSCTGSGNATPAGAELARAGTLPTLQVTKIATGLDLPWDVKPLPSGQLLITERDRRRLLLWDHGALTQVAFPAASVWVSGETGLMSLEVDPAFDSNRRFYTCQGGLPRGGGHDVRVIAWRLSEDGTTATHVRTLLHALPSTSGRHGGCRLLIASYGALLVGTGDAATGTNAHSLRSLGGKVLRIRRGTGAPWPKNPFVHSRIVTARYVYTWGHRNVQGLAQRADGTIWSVEHGPDRDDEVNLLRSGGDYGWNPVPGYNESVPMTDQSLPGRQLAARWRSGFPTLATSGATWVRGSAWKGYAGTLAVAALKAERLLFIRFDQAGHLVGVRTPSALRSYGRLRSVTRLPDGDLLVTTSNGGGSDVVLRVHPAG